MSINSCYSVNLYCENYGRSLGDENSEIFLKHLKSGNGKLLGIIGETYADCAKKAKRAGWYLSRNRQIALCPIWAAKRRKNDTVYT